MDFCNTVDLFYRAVPVARFRDWLIRSHIERCPRCQARLLSRDEALNLLVRPSDVGGVDRLWTAIVRQVRRAPAVPRPIMGRGSYVWRWAAALAVVLAVALSGFWLLREIERSVPRDLTASVQRFEIDYVNVGGAPARTFVYQPQGTDTVFVWAAKTP